MKLVLQKLWCLVALCASFQFVEAASAARVIAQQKPLTYMCSVDIASPVPSFLSFSEFNGVFKRYLNEGQRANLPLAFGLKLSSLDDVDPLSVDEETWGDVAKRSGLVALVFTRSETGQPFIGLYEAHRFNSWMAQTPDKVPVSDPTMRNNTLRSDGIFYFTLSRDGFHFVNTLDQAIRDNAGKDTDLAKICIVEGEVRKAPEQTMNNQNVDNSHQDQFAVLAPAVAIPAGDEDFARRLQEEADQAREQQQRDLRRAQEIFQGARQRLEAQQREREAEQRRQDEAEAAARQDRARQQYRQAAPAYQGGGLYRPPVQQAAIPPRPPRPSVLKYAIMGLAHGLVNKWLSGGAGNRSWVFAPWREWATAWLFGNVRIAYQANDMRTIRDGYLYYWFMSALLYGSGQAFGEIVPPLKLAVKPLALSATGPWRNIAVNDQLLQGLLLGLIYRVSR